MNEARDKYESRIKRQTAYIRDLCDAVDELVDAGDYIGASLATMRLLEVTKAFHKRNARYLRVAYWRVQMEAGDE